MIKILIIGASSGIGHELANLYAQEGNIVGITGRRENLLQQLHEKYPKTIFFAKHDITSSNNLEIIGNIVDTIGGLDILIICAGIGFENKTLQWNLEKQTIDTNVTAFTEIVNFGYNYFVKQKHGHLVGISSIAAIRGISACPAYSASKAYISNYLEAMRVLTFKNKLNIQITTIIPGFVDTQMAQGDGLFWVAPVKKAALHIKKAIDRKKSVAYITKRWKIIAWLLKRIPDVIYNRM